MKLNALATAKKSDCDAKDKEHDEWGGREEEALRLRFEFMTCVWGSDTMKQYAKANNTRRLGHNRERNSRESLDKTKQNE